MKWTEIWGRFATSGVAVYADFIDPFCYIGFHNMRRAAQVVGIDLHWRGFELNPETPAAGSPLETAANSDLRAGMWASVQAYAKKSNLDLEEPGQVPNTRMALLWVNLVPQGDVKNSLIERIYQAYLSDKKDIGNKGVLLQIATECGVPTEPLERLTTGTDSAPLEKFRREALGCRFPGMPGFRFRGKTFFGALSADACKAILLEEAVCKTR